MPVAGEKPQPRGLPRRSESADVILDFVNQKPRHDQCSTAAGVELNMPTGTLTRLSARCVHEPKGSRPVFGPPPVLLAPHAFCGVVKNVCCDVSLLTGAMSKVSPEPLPLPKPAIACTSCALEVG